MIHENKLNLESVILKGKISRQIKHGKATFSLVKNEKKRERKN